MFAKTVIKLAPQSQCLYHPISGTLCFTSKFAIAITSKVTKQIIPAVNRSQLFNEDQTVHILCSILNPI